MTSRVWVKASGSHGNGNCVEVAAVSGGVEVRDSKDPEGPVLRFTGDELEAFIDGARNGEFDHLVGPADLPPGRVYRDDVGRAWMHDGGGIWWYTGSATAHSEEDVRAYAAHPLIPLFRVDELIPDPADDGAVTALQIAAGHTSPQGPIRHVLRVLRARAESRGPRGTEGSKSDG